MIRQQKHGPRSAPVIVVDIGNTRTSLATWQANSLQTPLSVPTNDAAAFRDAYEAHAASLSGNAPAATVIGSVVPAALEVIQEILEQRSGRLPLVVGNNVPLPMDVAVEDTSVIGVDRVCAAAAAYDRLQTACTVVDFGTAVTVDLISDEGELLGGSILPGLALQFRALHDFTAQLPQVAAAIPELPYGRSTVTAIQSGVCRGLCGAVRNLVEGYATSLNRWPQVVATGGDLELLAAHCDFLDTLVPHLALRGVGLAYGKYIENAGV